jgi:hypothetical protein
MMGRGAAICCLVCFAIALVFLETIVAAKLLQSSTMLSSSFVSSPTTTTGSNVDPDAPPVQSTINADPDAPQVQGDNEEEGLLLEEDDEAPRRRLEFVHIPKTGGTVIESEAARHNVSWSICHFAFPEAARMISMNETICPKGSLKHMWPRVPKYHTCPWWHLPPQYFELQAQNPYEGADLFAVVRNPYERVISEYYYMGKHIHNYTADVVNDPAKFDADISMDLKHAHRMKRGDIARNRSANSPYFRNAGHWIPQYHFIFERRRRLVKHVLRFENLTSDFEALMELYDLPMRLPEKQVRVSHTRKLSVLNMTKETVLLIEEIYEEDFLEWGYELMSETIPQELFGRNKIIVARLFQQIAIAAAAAASLAKPETTPVRNQGN